MKRMVAAVLVALLILTAASVADQVRKLGDWIVQTGRDRFSGAENVIAVRLIGDQAMAVRCLDRRLSITVKVPAGFTGESDLIAVWFRADSHAVIQTAGESLDDDTLEILVLPQMVKDLRGAREVAWRFLGRRRQFDVVILFGNADQALRAVFRACSVV